MRISKDQRRALSAGLLVFGGVATAYVTLLRPDHERSVALRHRLDHLRRQADAARIDARRLVELRARVDGLREGIFRLREAAGSPAPDRIRALAAKHGVEIGRLASGPTVERSFSEVRSTHCTVRGLKGSVEPFLAELRQDLWVRSFEALSYSVIRAPGQADRIGEEVQVEFRLATVHAI